MKKKYDFGVMTTYEQDQPINKKTEMTLSQLLLFFLIRQLLQLDF